MQFLFYVFLFFSGSLNCAAFMAGIVEAVLNGCNFVSMSADDSYRIFLRKE